MGNIHHNTQVIHTGYHFGAKRGQSPVLYGISGRVTNIIVFSVYQCHITDPLMVKGIQKVDIIPYWKAVLQTNVNGMFPFF